MGKKQKILGRLIGLGVTLFFLFTQLTGNLDFTDIFESRAFDLMSKMGASGHRNPNIELVTITEQDLAEFGQVPWPRHVFARAINNLSRAGAKVIALNTLLPETEEREGLRTVQRLKELYDISGLAQRGNGIEFEKELSKAVVDLDEDSKFYGAVEEAGNVVLPVCFVGGSNVSDLHCPDFVEKYAYKRVSGVDQQSRTSYLMRFSKLMPPVPSFASVAAGMGHINLFPDRDGCVREQVHVVRYLRNIYFPSFSMAIVKVFEGLKDEDIDVVLGEGIRLRVSPSSMIRVPFVDRQMGTLIRWGKGPDLAFHCTPFSKVFGNNIPGNLFRDKIVIIGPTAPVLGDLFPTPVSGGMPGIEIVANSVANIINQDFLLRPSWLPYAELLALVFFGLFLILAIPRLGTGTGAVVIMGLVLLYGLAGVMSFFLSNIWLKATPPILLLLLGYAFIISGRFLITGSMAGKDDDEGTQQIRPSSREIRGPEHARALPNLELPVKGAHGGDTGARLPKAWSVDSNPTLGRYEVVAEIGKGAMGVVYKGLDPKIGRNVAIKTLNLCEFDEDDVCEVKERFFREAESAGLLAHPNIVTIYDCGEEEELAYIAMEYLQGDDLEAYTRPGHLFSIRDTLRVISCVLDALDYAHLKNVVHRDIKPANIMMVKDTKEIKVTDFGIARITSSSKTKPGTVLGTPSYMSPEQVSGKKVDGRSDIFSVGVVLFELLTGQKPFVGEDVTSLMFKIAKERHPSARGINPRTPRVVEKIIDRALEKDLGRRYQRAGEMGAHLKKVIARVDEIISHKQSKGS